MTREELERALASDDPAERAHAAEEAERDPALAGHLAALPHIAEAAGAWRAREPALPRGFEQRVLAGFAAKLRALDTSEHAPPASRRVRAASLRGRPTPARRALWRAAASAAAMVVVALALVSLERGPALVPAGSSEALVDAPALHALEEATRTQRALAASQELRLRAALATLDPGTRESAIARLGALESSIVELERFLDDNPFHPGARLALLEAAERRAVIVRDTIESAEAA